LKQPLCKTLVTSMLACYGLSNEQLVEKYHTVFKLAQLFIHNTGFLSFC